MSPLAKAQLQIHFCVLLWGFTAILGKLISLGALQLVWWRMLIVSAVLFCVPKVWREVRPMSGRLRGAYAGVGMLVALHWLTFYAAIKLSNASVGVTCLAVSPAFISVLEPWLARRRFQARELLLGVAVVPGVALVVGGVPPSMHVGIAVGILSALFVALFSSLNKRLAGPSHALAVTALELGAGTALLTVLAPFVAHVGPAFPLPSARDAVLLGALALGYTLLPFSLALVALRNLSAFGAQLAINMEPVYTVLLAILFFGEQRELTLKFYGGVLLILSAVIAYPLWFLRVKEGPLP